MSLTTRCPACATTFRVVPDQLKVSEGWVRCGRCSDVFDARVTLVSQLPVVTEVVEPMAAAEADVADNDNDNDNDSTAAASAEPGAAADSAEVTDAAEAAGFQHTQPLPEEPAVQASVQGPSGAAGQIEPTLSLAPAVDQVSFMRQARRRALWRRPVVRGALAAMALLSVLALAGQLAYHHRDELAQRAPALQPLLSALCQPLQCRVGPPRRIEAVAIDASAFTRLQPDTFRLQITLSNASAQPVALPALELTLTDTQDQPVIRRVLQPADLGADAPASLAAAGEWATGITLTVSPAAAPAVTGYKLLAFYP